MSVGKVELRVSRADLSHMQFKQGAANILRCISETGTRNPRTVTKTQVLWFTCHYFPVNKLWVSTLTPEQQQTSPPPPPGLCPWFLWTPSILRNRQHKFQWGPWSKEDQGSSPHSPRHRCRQDFAASAPLLGDRLYPLAKKHHSHRELPWLKCPLTAQSITELSSS